MADPQRVGRYLIKQVLGHGGMGTVYLAEDPLLKRRVAIKVVRATGEARNHAMMRFKREAEISAQLNHPNVVTVFDVGIEPEIGPFLTMEYIEGKNLAQHIKARTLDTESAVRVLIQAMRALRAAHRMAIVHRDVKPENILLSEEGRGKLMDFGIARSFTHSPLMSEFQSFAEPDFAERASEDALGTTALRITGSGDFLGSPAYAPPEILKGADGTPSSDRYSFAATAFELLTGGKLPHPGTSLAAIIAHILKEPPHIPPDMDPRVGQVFDRALSADPDHRHPTLVEFMEELIDALPLAAGAKARLFTSLNQTDDGTDVIASRRSMPMPVAAPPKPLMTGPARPKRIDLDETDAPARPAAPRPPVAPRTVSEPIPWGTWIKWGLAAMALAFLAQWIYPRLDQSPRSLTVRTHPPGAKVFVDGAFLGQTPLEGAKVSRGARALSLQREGFLESLHVLGPGDQTLSLTLEVASRGIAVDSDPPGATVTLNGIAVGKTPLGALPSVDPRSEIIVSLEGYHPYTGRINAGIPKPIVLEKLGPN